MLSLVLFEICDNLYDHTSKNSLSNCLVHTYIYLQFRFLQGLLREGGRDFDSTNVMSAVRVLRKSTITSELRETLGGMRSLFRYFENFTNETRQFAALHGDTVGVCVILQHTITQIFDFMHWSCSYMQPRIAIAPLAALDNLISTAGYEYIITWHL